LRHVRGFNLNYYLVLLLLVVPSICSAGAFDPIASNARAWGMGGAYTAVVADATAVYWNPAGLVGVRRPSVALTHFDVQSLGLLSFDQIVFAQPFVFNNVVAVAWSRLGTTGQVTFMDYAENTFILSYQQPVLNNLSLGLNFKVFQVQYDQPGSGFGVDLGVRYQFLPELTLGMMIENFNRPEIYWTTGAYDRLPVNMRVGLAGEIDENTIVALDGDRLLDLNPKIYLGAERWFFGRLLALRVGVNYLSLERRFQPAGGLGLRVAFLEFAYAYASHFDLSGNHVLSLNWRF